MAFGVYKPDQGYWTRMISTAAVGVIALAGAAWLWGQLELVNVERKEYVQAIGVLAFISVIGFFVYLLYWKSRETVEFFIATEGEMKKVNWSTRREIIGSTWVVIIVAVAIALILFVVDLFFSEVFKMMGVVYGNSVILDFIQGLLSGSGGGGGGGGG